MQYGSCPVGSFFIIIFWDVWHSSFFPALHISIPVAPSSHRPIVYSAHTLSFLIPFDWSLSDVFLPSFVSFFRPYLSPFPHFGPEWVHFTPRPHLVSSFVSPLLQPLDIIYLIDLDFEGFCCCCGTAEVWGSWWPQWAVYPACTWAGWGWRRRRDGLFGGAVRRWGGGVQGQCWDQTTTLKAWKKVIVTLVCYLCCCLLKHIKLLNRPHLHFSAGDDSVISCAFS